MDMNKITLIGHLGSDPSKRTIPGKNGGEEKHVTSFRFAVNSPFDDVPIWLTIECWGGLCDVAKQLNLKTGSRLYLEGKLVPDKTTGGPQVWIPEKGDKQGVAQATFVVWADGIIALDARQAE
jgi:single-stranded DNA-binding protein